jgi:glycerol uptake facilitator-like aquaporin
MSLAEAIGYIISQIVAAVCAAFLLRAVLGGVATGLGRPELAQGVALGATTLTITPAAGFVIEAVLGFFLVIVVLTTAVARTAGNLAPLAIGMTVALDIMMGAALTGATFNPAIALGPMVATGNFTDAWLYVIAPVVGALRTAVAHRRDQQNTNSPHRVKLGNDPEQIIVALDVGMALEEGTGSLPNFYRRHNCTF